MAVIIRHRQHADFTIYPNALVRDPRLSFRATGVLVYLLSLPDGSDTDSVKLAQRKREGRDAIRAAFTELVDAGYVERGKHQDDKGMWITTIAVTDVPKTGFPASDRVAPGKPSPGNLDVGSSGAKKPNTDDKDYNALSPVEPLENGAAAPPTRAAAPTPNPGPVRTDDDGTTFLPGTGPLPLVTHRDEPVGTKLTREELRRRRTQAVGHPNPPEEN